MATLHLIGQNRCGILANDDDADDGFSLSFQRYRDTDSHTLRCSATRAAAAMENKFIPQAIEIVTRAINEDNSKNYQEAFVLYKKALEHFMVGVKCTSGAGRRLQGGAR
ncbi:unnamed protein product [Phytophthora fragariaefolia]|uniref:Unnamed protein product n=1 Tax=Phytophthora fragariaefolia TaxID=1490495 RepID=A0A9W6XN00_9STRA|nr:unnamed protein product [Phytophthora fragariaefolia]